MKKSIALVLFAVANMSFNAQATDKLTWGAATTVCAAGTLVGVGTIILSSLAIVTPKEDTRGAEIRDEINLGNYKSLWPLGAVAVATIAAGVLTKVSYGKYKLS
jgi:hypothetical protein